MFPSGELGHALVTEGLPGGGSRSERAARLLSAGQRANAPATDVLSLIRVAALRRVCAGFGLSARSKAEMVSLLVELLSEDERALTPAGPPRGVATPPAVVEYLRGLELPRWRVRDEADAEVAIAGALRREFSNVSTQYSVGGFLGYRIDIDIGDGNVGIEVKLSEALISSSSEAYRAIGQAVLYGRRRYQNNVILAVVGPEAVRSQPAMSEIEALLSNLGVMCVHILLR